MPGRIAIQIKDGVADVRPNRPDKMNAIDQAMFAALQEAGDEVSADPSVRAVVLSGEGRAFCAGLDFASFRGMAGDGERGSSENALLSDAAAASPANFA